MAIREEEVEQLVERRPDAIVVPTGNGMAVDLGDHAGAVARVRRHVLRRLLIADVVGLATAAIVSPLLVSALSSNPATAADQLGPIMILNLVMIPVFIGVFAVYSLYRGSTRRISLSVFSDLRNIVHALLVSGFLYAVVGYVGHQAVRLPGRERRQDPGHVHRGRRRRPAGPCGLVRAHGPGAGGLGAGHRGRDRQAGPDGGEPPPCPLERQLRRLRRRQPTGPERRARASSRTCPSSAAATTWPGWSSASRGPTPSGPRRC